MFMYHPMPPQKMLQRFGLRKQENVYYAITNHKFPNKYYETSCASLRLAVMMSSANGMTFSMTFTIIAKDSQGLSKNPLSRFSPCLTDFLCPPITDLRNTLMEKTLAHDIIRCHHDAAGDDPGNRINDREQREIRHPPENRHDEENTQQAGTGPHAQEAESAMPRGANARHAQGAAGRGIIGGCKVADCPDKRQRCHRSRFRCGRRAPGSPKSRPCWR